MFLRQCFTGPGSVAYGIGKRLIKINFISLVNLIYREAAGGGNHTERSCTNVQRIELSKILQDTEYRSGMMEGYSELKADLGEPGVSGRIGRRMIELLTLEME